MAGNSAASVLTNNRTQEQIKQQMNANSNAWHTADAATKAQLEAQNKSLAAQLGGSVSFDSGSGTWSGAAAQSQPKTTLPTPNSYEQQIRDMNAALLAKNVAELDRVYQNNTAELNRTQEKIAPEYQAARNQTAATSEREKRSFAEYAAASGLNSGTGGQAELARGVTLQNNMSAINKGEADANSEIELKRTQLGNDYRSAIAQAKAQGDYTLAQQLYQEWVRYDEAIMNTALNQDSIDYRNWYANEALSRDDRSYANSTTQQNYSNQLAMAQMLAQYGDFSGLAALGIDTAQLQKVWQENRALELAAAQKSASGTNGTKKTLGTNNIYQDLSDAGATDLSTAYAKLIAFGYTDAEASTMAKYFEDWLKAKNKPVAPDGNSIAPTASQPQGMAPAAMAQPFNGGNSKLVNEMKKSIEQDIMRRLLAGEITPQQAQALAVQYGLD